MANPSVTYTFTNSTTADASEVNQNFSDVLASLTDGTKSINIDAITAAGAATFNGNVALGSASGDTATVNATMSFATTPKVDQINEKTLTNGVALQGATDGNVVASGNIGEQQIGYCSSAAVTTVADTEIDVTGCSVTLTAGIWDLSYCLSAAAYRASGTSPGWCRVRITDSSDVVESDTENSIAFENSASGAFQSYGVISNTKRIYLTSSKTFKIRLTSNLSTATGAAYVYKNGDTTGSVSGNESTSFIRAVRVA